MTVDAVDAVMVSAGHALYGHPPTLAFTRDACREMIRAGIPGSFVECGVAAGSHPAVMAAVLDHAGELARGVHLFDSFEGIPHAGPQDDSQPGMNDREAPPRDGALVTTGVSAASVDQVRSNFRAWGAPLACCRFHVGWFQDTAPRDAASVGPIAYLRLDGDLYASTRVCLEHLYPLVSRGGIVCVDDWLLPGCRRAVAEYLDRTGERPTIETIRGGHGPVWWYR